MARSSSSDEANGCLFLILIIVTGVIWYNWGLLTTVGLLSCFFLVVIALTKVEERKKGNLEYKKLQEKLWALMEEHENLTVMCQALRSENHELKYRELKSKNRPAPVSHSTGNRRETSQREFFDNLDELGFQTYEEYLRSDLWRETKSRYINSEYPHFCLVCGSKSFDLHHRTYERLGHEELYDLVPLCNPHHTALHKLLDQNPELSVKDTYDYLARLNDTSHPEDQPMERPYPIEICPRCEYRNRIRPHSRNYKPVCGRCRADLNDPC
jgi:hypothetical protein